MNNSNFSLGRRVHKDDRDQQHLLVHHLTAAKLPVSKTWSIAATHLDQGETGTCVGHGWRNFLRCAPVRTSTMHPSPFDIYRAAVLLDPWKDNDDEAKLPDFSPKMDSGTTVRAGAKATADLEMLAEYAWAFNLQPAVEWVLTKGPLVIGITWYDSMFDANSKGVISISPSAQPAGGHCLLWRGVNTSTGQALLTNSWGDSWAKRGDALISLRDMERLIHEDGEVCTAVQKAA
jgi:hypothetical protein